MFVSRVTGTRIHTVDRVPLQVGRRWPLVFFGLALHPSTLAARVLIKQGSCQPRQIAENA